MNSKPRILRQLRKFLKENNLKSRWFGSQLCFSVWIFRYDEEYARIKAYIPPVHDFYIINSLEFPANTLQKLINKMIEYKIIDKQLKHTLPIKKNTHDTHRRNSLQQKITQKIN